MFDGPPNGAMMAWQSGQQSVRFVHMKDNDKRDLLPPVVGHAMVKCNNLLIVWGGYNRDHVRLVNNYRTPRALYIFPAAMHLTKTDQQENWIVYPVSKGDVPPPASGSCAVFLNEQILFFGGYTILPDEENITVSYSNRIYMLDICTESWILPGVVSAVPSPRDKTTGWVHENKCYFFGGYGPTIPDFMPHEFVGHTYDYVLDVASGFSWNNQLLVCEIQSPRAVKWGVARTSGNEPTPRAACASAYINERNCTFLYGGRGSMGRMDDLYMLDLNSLVWTLVETTSIKKPVGRSWSTLSAISPYQLILYGGYSNSSEPLGDFWRLFLDVNERDKVSARWDKFEVQYDKEIHRIWHTSAYVDGQLFICGGGEQPEIDFGAFASNMIKLRVQPSSLLSLCIGAVARCEETIQPLPEKLKITCAWARYVQSSGTSCLSFNKKQFDAYSLKDITRVSRLVVQN